MRVPTPGVQRAGGGERRAVARPGEDGFGWGVPRSGTDGVAVGKGEDRRRGHVPVERAAVVRDGRFGKVSWPSSPQPHCGVGRREVGQEGVEVRGPFDVGLNRAGSSVRARAGSRVGVRDPEARRTTNSVSVSSSSSAMESPSRSTGENSALLARRPSWKTSEFSRRR